MMIYIVMCGGNYRQWETPRHLYKINGETLVERTLRLLKELGVKDIYISTNHPDMFSYLGVPIINHHNSYDATSYNNFKGYWADAFVPLNIPCCYICGDVWFSKSALSRIVKTEANDILFFATAKPYHKKYPKKYEEPLAFKVADQKMFREKISDIKHLQDNHSTNRLPISWELYRIIDGIDPNKHLFGKRFVGVHDFACDIDYPSEIVTIENATRGLE